MLAFRYGTTAQTIQNALRGRARTITPDELCGLILRYVRSEVSPIESIPRRGRGRQPGRLKRTDARITTAADLRSRGLSLYAMKGEVFPEQSSRELAYKSIKELVRRYRSEIEAEQERLASLPGSQRQFAVNRSQYSFWPAKVS
jgi:hypothetical protein